MLFWSYERSVAGSYHHINRRPTTIVAMGNRTGFGFPILLFTNSKGVCAYTFPKTPSPILPPFFLAHLLPVPPCRGAMDLREPPVHSVTNSVDGCNRREGRQRDPRKRCKRLFEPGVCAYYWIHLLYRDFPDLQQVLADEFGDAANWRQTSNKRFGYSQPHVVS